MWQTRRSAAPARGCGESLRTPQDVRDAYERYGGELFGFVLKTLDDRWLAEDVVQETFVRAWRTGRRPAPARGTLRSWLFAIARDAMADAAGHRGTGPASGGPRARRTGGADPFDRLLSNIQLDEALRRLSPEHRRTVVEVYYNGRTGADLARRLGVPASAVRGRLYYGVRALRLVLEENGWLA
ncbi:sigma-70 family RNA polymerase sigma factor [Streptantibioticus silvisoli]|uniref:RNA polymerase sigma factor n=1 Tax=Streptantibioticus silvisoli TaxID=2705255 RepID=A0ABT6VTD4_9ACTN|nr:sigma-70 family RNA polymerase sigma factor [Streptantibioticus silvisoli]MDI5961719.1 sigma-70 family RNA polymerase sigma factor [Streptantibioticus silvisoli]